MPRQTHASVISVAHGALSLLDSPNVRVVTVHTSKHAADEADTAGDVVLSVHFADGCPKRLPLPGDVVATSRIGHTTYAMAPARDA